MIATRRLYTALAAFAMFGTLAGLFPVLLPAWLGTALALTVATLLDAWRLRQNGPLSLQNLEYTRELPSSLPLGVWTDVKIHLFSPQQSLTLDFFDQTPTSFSFEGLPATLHLKAGARQSFNYRVRPLERGEHTFLPAHTRIHGPLGLLKRNGELGESSPIRVLPNFRAVSRYALLAAADQVGQLGIRTLRRRGIGSEFDHLREYRDGDLIRQIDWKATARRNTLIAREYQDERDQHIVFLLDCGRHMRSHDGELSHFDHVLNATLLLGHVALQRGDTIALATFGGQDIWIPRLRGPQAITTLVDQIYDLETTTAPSDFTDIAHKLSVNHRRRSLVVILTNLYDTPTEALLRAINLLRTRHLVLIASLREAETDHTREQPIHTFENALTVAAAHDFLRQRTRAHQSLTQQGAIVLDTPPADLSVQLINQYLHIKRAGML